MRQATPAALLAARRFLLSKLGRVNWRFRGTKGLADRAALFWSNGWALGVGIFLGLHRKRGVMEEDDSMGNDEFTGKYTLFF